MSYQIGRGLDGPWTEGSQQETFTFAPSNAGVYGLEIEMSEVGSGSSGIERTNSSRNAVVRARKHSWHPMAAAAPIFAFLAGLVYHKEMMRQSQLLSGSDWSDD